MYLSEGPVFGLVPWLFELVAACLTLSKETAVFTDLPLESSRKPLLQSSSGLHKKNVSVFFLSMDLVPDSETAAVLL